MSFDHNINVILYENEHRKDRVHCSLLFKFGFFYRQIGSQKNFTTETINQASPFILAEHLNWLLAQSSIVGSCSTSPKETIAYFETSAQNTEENLSEILSLITAENTFVEIFEDIKRRAKDAFAKYYADSENRALLKAFEIAGYEEQFRLGECINALDTITCEEYLAFTRKMLHPDNLLIFLEGALEGLAADDVVAALPKEFLENCSDDPSMVLSSGSERLSKDYFVAEPGRENLIVTVYKCYFDNLALEDTYLFLLLAAIAATEQKAIVMYDHRSPSVLCCGVKPPALGKTPLQDITEDQFESLKLQAGVFFHELTLHRPQDFGAMIVTAIAYNVAIFKIMLAYEQLSFADFQKLIAKSYPEIQIGIVQMKKLGDEENVRSNSFETA